MPERQTQRTILVVDDVATNISVLRGILSPMYAIKVATSGRLALALASRDPKPDLVLLDVMMPEMDGYETCRQLKSNPETSAIPVIFITAKSDTEDVAYGFELGAADYIAKPVNGPIVLARVRTHIALYDERVHLEDLVRSRTRQIEELQSQLVLQLSRAAEFRDNETSAHTTRVARFAHLLALSTGMSPKQAEPLLLAAMMHDVGKIGIPDQILLKPGKFTPDEFEIMKRHAEIGAKIIGPQESEVLRMAREIALTHHEKWNGQGYPHGLKGEEIPLLGRVTALADVFDALTTERPYKNAWSMEEALSYIEREAGAHFDPRLAKLFIALEPELRRICDTYRDAEPSEPIQP